MFTDNTHFTGDTFIPNLNESCDGLLFHEWREQWEEQCLRMTLGNCVYDELLTQVVWNENTYQYELIDTAEDKWKWLVNGHSYTKADITNTNTFAYSNCGCGCQDLNCDTYKWEGIVKTIDRRIKPTEVKNGEFADGITINKSYPAYYIYWLWGLKTDTFTSSTGEQTADVKNATRVSNYHKRIEAHNKFVTWVTDCNSNGKVGLYRFMQDFSDLFPEWQGTCLKYESIW